MPQTIATSRRASQINSLDAVRRHAVNATLPVNGEATPHNDKTTPYNAVEHCYTVALHDAIDDEGLSRKEAAALLVVDPAQLSRGAVSVERLEKLPLSAQQRFLELACAHAGLKTTKATAVDELVREIRRNMDFLLDLVEQVQR